MDKATDEEISGGVIFWESHAEDRAKEVKEKRRVVKDEDLKIAIR